eukprot:GFUD01017304.1.p1 GENE.GFUD01017304.1~~GFUD01017304.1.p1  ORF type:complete len:292 (-),score=89.85 GFUD01017304.1:178-1053(-)
MVSYTTYPVLATLLVTPSTIMTVTTDTTQNKFSFYLKDGETASKGSLQSTNTTACFCSSNHTDTFLNNAHTMMDQMLNKTTMLSKIRHRATHSNEALWASFTLSGLMVLLALGVLHSKMWNDRNFISYSESQPVKFEQYNPKSEILVKDLLRSRGRNLLTLFTKRRKSKSGNTLQMETFMSGKGDTVDSAHQALLESSDEDFFLESDSESEEDTVFRINSRTGQWEGLEEGETEEMTMSLLGNTARKRNRASSDSSDSRYSLLNSSLSKDLVRLSDNELDEEEEKQLINVG